MHLKMGTSKETNSSVDYSDDFNQMWNVIYKLQAAIEPVRACVVAMCMGVLLLLLWQSVL